MTDQTPAPPAGWDRHDPREWGDPRFGARTGEHAAARPPKPPRSLAFRIARVLGIVVVVLAVIVLLAVACTTSAKPPAAPTTGPAITSVDPGDQSNIGAADEPQQARPFGETATYPRGSTVTVSAPTAYKPSTYAAGNTGSRALLFTVTLTNNTPDVFDTGAAYITATYNGIAASQIFDSAKDINGFTGQQLQPGKSVKARIVFSIANDEQGAIQVDVRPSPFEPTAVFTGQG